MPCGTALLGIRPKLLFPVFLELIIQSASLSGDIAFDPLDDFSWCPFWWCS